MKHGSGNRYIFILSSDFFFFLFYIMSERKCLEVFAIIPICLSQSNYKSKRCHAWRLDASLKTIARVSKGFLSEQVFSRSLLALVFHCAYVIHYE